jgi:hypothetical protein
MKSSISALPGPVSQAIGSGHRPERNIGDAADIEHRDWMRPRHRIDDGAMKNRHQRSALPAGRDVGGAEIMRHRDAEPFRQRRAIAHLDGEPRLRPVDHGLAMETDHGDIARRDAVVRQQPLDRLGLG